MARETDPPEREDVIQTRIVKALKEAGWYFHSVPNEGAGSSAIRSARLVSMGMRSGVADLVVWLGNGKVAYLEVKNARGRQSEAQKTFQRICESNGYHYRVVRSEEEVLEALEEWKHG